MPGRPRLAESRTRYHIRDQAARRGWDLQHTFRGGDLVEENEIMDVFPEIGLGQTRPDFLFCIAGEPAAVLEAKNETGKRDIAITEARGYAEAINRSGRYDVRVAVGASGTEEQGFIVDVEYLTGDGWKPLSSDGAALTTFPSKHEIELAVIARDATTRVTVPSQQEFNHAAVEVSKILRLARVEAPARPAAIGALVLAMYSPDPTGTEASHLMDLTEVNNRVVSAIKAASGLAGGRESDLIDTLRITGPSFQQLGPHIGRVISVLRRLNVRAVMHSGVDFLGNFYEAFLRYGYDNNALEIVFTPRHITRLCVGLVNVDHTDRVVDLACGTGGFLVSAFDRMMADAPSPAARDKVKDSLWGYDTNPTVWALAVLNMYFRGDGKSHITRASSLTDSSRKTVSEKFTKSFLNPPFSQREEPERDFIDAAVNACAPSGEIAVVVKAGVFADDEHRAWRNIFTRNHTVLAVISLPDDLFYPTAAPTSILIARTHVPQPASSIVYLARVSNDGFEKRKGKRVERPGSQLPSIEKDFTAVRQGTMVENEHATTLSSSILLGGAEWSPQEWLPQAQSSPEVSLRHQDAIAGSILRTVAEYPGALSGMLPAFGEQWSDLPPLPYGTGTKRLDELFVVSNGRSSGEKNYSEGDTPYISSGDLTNSIVSIVSPIDEEVFVDGGITVTAFGQAFVQPWPFMARGNGGSSVRVLAPRYRMTMRELIWFAAQINEQRWRFFYARMAIKGRIVRLNLEVPLSALLDHGESLREGVEQFLAAYHDQRALLRGPSALTAERSPDRPARLRAAIARVADEDAELLARLAQ